MSATECEVCGEKFETNFSLTLKEALRAGAILRGMDIEENEVRLGEDIAVETRRKILASGDEKLIKIIRTLPDEGFGRLKSILDNA